jgi:hypothetical protein
VTRENQGLFEGLGLGGPVDSAEGGTWDVGDHRRRGRARAWVRSSPGRRVDDVGDPDRCGSTTPRSVPLKSTWLRFDDCLAQELAPSFKGSMSMVLDGLGWPWMARCCYTMVRFSAGCDGKSPEVAP